MTSLVFTPSIPFTIQFDRHIYWGTKVPEVLLENLIDVRSFCDVNLEDLERFAFEFNSNANDGISQHEKDVYLLFDIANASNVLTILVAICMCRKMTLDSAMRYVKTLCTIFEANNIIEMPFEIHDHILRYRPPMTIVVGGDRHASTKFCETIDLELKKLPKYSRIITGDAKGVDAMVTTLVKKHSHLQLEIYPADWNRYGLYAGPFRNRQMLDVERPDEVWGFHQDITVSKGTKDLLEAAHHRGIPTFLSDFKRKSRFRGNWNEV